MNEKHWIVLQNWNKKKLGQIIQVRMQWWIKWRMLKTSEKMSEHAAQDEEDCWTKWGKN